MSGDDAEAGCGCFIWLVVLILLIVYWPAVSRFIGEINAALRAYGAGG